MSLNNIPHWTSKLAGGLLNRGGHGIGALATLWFATHGISSWRSAFLSVFVFAAYCLLQVPAILARRITFLSLSKREVRFQQKP